ncbi:10200_t:CDS:2 [Scutellospora calospora]|uniref:10200_t:CDS:1 n=1 Tax=Scutellospora calospora TaxID=85575 RepID=A0ACA9JZW7_9GLOM|nr:10200_t:CDS:2 [Scutellospora calospora]
MGDPEDEIVDMDLDSDTDYSKSRENKNPEKAKDHITFSKSIQNDIGVIQKSPEFSKKPEQNPTKNIPKLINADLSVLSKSLSQKSSLPPITVSSQACQPSSSNKSVCQENIQNLRQEISSLHPKLISFRLLPKPNPFKYKIKSNFSVNQNSFNNNNSSTNFNVSPTSMIHKQIHSSPVSADHSIIEMNKVIKSSPQSNCQMDIDNNSTKTTTTIPFVSNNFEDGEIMDSNYSIAGPSNTCEIGLNNLVERVNKLDLVNRLSFTNLPSTSINSGLNKLDKTEIDRTPIVTATLSNPNFKPVIDKDNLFILNNHNNFKYAEKYIHKEVKIEPPDELNSSINGKVDYHKDSQSLDTIVQPISPYVDEQIGPQNINTNEVSNNFFNNLTDHSTSFQRVGKVDKGKQKEILNNEEFTTILNDNLKNLEKDFNSKKAKEKQPTPQDELRQITDESELSKDLDDALYEFDQAAQKAYDAFLSLERVLPPETIIKIDPPSNDKWKIIKEIMGMSKKKRYRLNGIQVSQLNTNRIQNSHLNLNGVQNSQLNLNGVQNSQLNSNSIHLNSNSNGTQNSHLNSNSNGIQNSHLNSNLNGIQNSHLNSNLNGIHTPQLNSNGIHTPQLNSNRIHTPQLNSNGLYTPQLNSNGLYTPQLNSNGIYTPQLNSNGIYTPQLNSSGIHTPQLNGIHTPQLNSNGFYGFYTPQLNLNGLQALQALQLSLNGVQNSQSNRLEYRDSRSTPIHANNKNACVNESVVNANLIGDVLPDDDLSSGSRRQSSRKVHDTRSQKPPSANLRSRAPSFGEIRPAVQPDLNSVKRKSLKQNSQSPKSGRTTRSATREKETPSPSSKIKSPNIRPIRPHVRKPIKNLPDFILNFEDITNFHGATTDEQKNPTTSAFGIYCLELSSIHFFNKGAKTGPEFVAYAAQNWIKLTEDQKEIYEKKRRVTVQQNKHRDSFSVEQQIPSFFFRDPQIESSRSSSRR